MRAPASPKAEKEYILFCDESVKDGEFYSNFYGGLIVGASQLDRVTKRLNGLKERLHLHGEIKWSKVTDQYLDKYTKIVGAFFDEVNSGHLRVRIMFTQNALVPTELTTEDKEYRYFKLYYQFIKHGFGLKFIPIRRGGTRLRLYFHEFPETREKAERFRGYLLGLSKSKEFLSASLKLFAQDITEVRSHDHVLLQCLDIVLGAMAFRLNEKHKARSEGQRRRGKRTRAKERLYRLIVDKVRQTRPNFNFGMTTGRDRDPATLWHHPYRHWCFTPKKHEYDEGLTKSATRKGKGPDGPT